MNETAGPTLAPDQGESRAARREYQISDYAIIGNCETAALVNSEGGIDWLCLPQFDSASFFGALVDREKGGEFAIFPAQPFRVERGYLGDSAVLETRFETDHGTAVLTDFFVTARNRQARFYDFTSLAPTRKLVRLLEVTRGETMPIEFRCDARPDYARSSAVWHQISNHPPGFRCLEAALFTNMPLDEKLRGEFTAERGKIYFAVLDFSHDPNPPDVDVIRRWLCVTAAFWEEWNLFNYYRGLHEKIVRRSAVTLKLLTFAPSGAFVAALTTSLPERVGGDLNWDYRFAWVRDTALFINTMFRIGYSGEAKAYLQFVTRCSKECANSDIDVLLPIDGEGDHEEEQFLDHLAGYRGSRPVRVGNRAARQIQLDNYGHLMQSLYYYRATGGRFDADKKKLAERCLRGVAKHWQEEDSGIWETLERKHYTIGKVMAWIACQRGCDLLGEVDPKLRKLADNIREQVVQRGMRRLDGKDYLAATYEEDQVDAASLLAFTTGFLPLEIARTTRAEIERRLGCGGPLLYRSEKSRRSEGAFLICSFWWINHLIQENELKRAEQLLDQVIALLSPLGLLSEEIDPESGQFLGNFPQAFSHLGLIGSILSLEEAKKMPRQHSLPDHKKFRMSVGATLGLRGVIAGFVRVPKLLRLLFSRRSKLS